MGGTLYMRVVFHVRCHGEPNEMLEEAIMDLISKAVEYPQIDWGILTIGREYYHDNPLCDGHPSAEDECPHERR